MRPKENRWFSNLSNKQKLVPWHPATGDFADVPLFFASAMVLVERAFADRGLDFIFTADVRSVPMAGERTIVFIMSNEHGLIPTYASSVAAVFKCYGGRPFFSPVLGPRNPRLVLASALKNLHLARTSASQLIAFLKARLSRRPVAGPPYVEHVPLGFHSAPVGEVPPMAERPLDVFFAGSVQHGVRQSLRQRFNSKQLARAELLKMLPRLTRTNPEIRVKLVTSAGFIPHAVAWGFIEPTSVLAEPEYMRTLAQSKICLAPRGTSFETFRHYEGAAMGCAIISECLPPTDFYRAAPFLIVRDWAEAHSLILDLLKDPPRLQSLQDRTRAWYETWCAPSALAGRVAERLQPRLPHLEEAGTTTAG